MTARHFTAALAALAAFTALAGSGPSPAAAQAKAAAAQENAAAIVGRSARVYRSLSNLRADFVQVIYNPMIDSAETRGTLAQAGPARFAMRFSDPPGEAIVMDGEHLWVYAPSTTPGQVLRLPLPSGGPAYGYNVLGWLLDRPAERYRATYLRTERLHGRVLDVVELVPAVPDLPFEQAVLWLDRGDALPRRLEILERSGATRTLILSRLRVNGALPRAAFRFEVPRGVRVVDQ